MANGKRLARAGGTAPRTVTKSMRLPWSQGVAFAAGIAVVGLLAFKPSLGIHLFWNVLIPVAPALILFFPGLWRNLCPLGYTSLLLQKFSVGGNRKLSSRANDRFVFLGVLVLFTLIPLRHLVFDLHGPWTAALLLILGLSAAIIGNFFAMKSGWCSGLCPVHPVEKLYGIRPVKAAPNGHCEECRSCVQICPDSTPAMDP
ncbi:MAG: hypothetical protein DWQ01_07555 [Planctomycetota bacterium]|nr:MAG: hypothetical protein DWQ01_07555 [Planctomycetota bacterium]